MFALIAVLSVNFHGVEQKFKEHDTEGAQAVVTGHVPLPKVTPVTVTAMKPLTEIATFGVTANENGPQQYPACASVNPTYTALGARLEGDLMKGKLADAVAPTISPALVKTAADNAVLAVHGIEGFATDSNEKETIEPWMKFPDENTALKMPLKMVAVPAAPKAGEEKFNGAETGHIEYPVRVTITLAFEGMLAVAANVTEYLTPEAPATELLTETASEELNMIEIAGKRPTALTARTVPVRDVTLAAKLVAAACAK